MSSIEFALEQIMYAKLEMRFQGLLIAAQTL